MGMKSFGAGIAVGLLAAFGRAAWLRSARATAPDERLAARVRAAVERVASHPSHLLIVADGGSVVLTGQAPVEELEPLIEAVRNVRGVERVLGQLGALAGEADADEGTVLIFEDELEVGAELDEDRWAEELGAG